MYKGVPYVKQPETETVLDKMIDRRADKNQQRKGEPSLTVTAHVKVYNIVTSINMLLSGTKEKKREKINRKGKWAFSPFVLIILYFQTVYSLTIMTNLFSFIFFS